MLERMIIRGLEDYPSKKCRVNYKFFSDIKND